jgi:riboflavin biosynthesis pyrimidine reductase
VPPVRGRHSLHQVDPLTGDDHLTPVAAAGAAVTARVFVAGLDLRPARDGGPRVVGAMIASLDGHATVDGRAGGLGNPADRALLRELRTAADAVLVGRNTLTTERYATLLDPDQQEWRAAGGRTAQPLVATISRRWALLADVPLLSEESIEIVVYTDDAGSASLAGAKLTTLDPLTPAAAVADLAATHGARLIVCEGGPSLLHDLAADGTMTDLVLTVAPLLVAGEGPSILTGTVFADPVAMTLASAARAGDYLMLHYRR